MNRCKNCKYFQHDYNNDYSWKEKYEYNYGECRCNKFEYEETYNYEEKKETDKLLYYDYESYSAGFFVGKDFGCIHFKKADNEILEENKSNENNI